MSVSVDAPPRQRPGPPTRWVAVAAATIAAIAVVTMLYNVVNRPAARDAPAAGQAPQGGTLRDELAVRVVAILEAATPTEHTAHGHDLGDEPGRLLCTAEVYGYEPAGATRAGDVRRVVGYHFCAIMTKDRPWDFAYKLVGPIGVDLAEPPGVRVAESGDGYQARVREVVGDQYFQQALKGFSDDRIRKLQDRYVAEVGTG